MTVSSPMEGRRTSWRLKYVLLGGCLAGFLGAVTAQVVYVTVGGNFHTVIPGQVYRCAQPSQAGLEEMIRTYGIRTVINLRGDCNDDPLYVAECLTARRLHVTLVDVGMWARLPPPTEQVRRLIETLDHAEYPILLHCWSGGDRSGLAAAAALLLREGVRPNQARRQLALRFGHFSHGRAACMDHFFDAYARWLTAQGMDHRPDHFRHWACVEYRPEMCLK